MSPLTFSIRRKCLTDYARFFYGQTGQTPADKIAFFAARQRILGRVALVDIFAIDAVINIASKLLRRGSVTVVAVLLRYSRELF